VEDREEYQPLAGDIDDEDQISVSNMTMSCLFAFNSFLDQNPHQQQGVRMSAAEPLTTHETAKLASVFCFVWFIANWAVNASLDYTSVASATILSSMSGKHHLFILPPFSSLLIEGFFTLGIGRIFRVETLTIVKTGAVLTR
jgi:solute carrier family 35, member F5